MKQTGLLFLLFPVLLSAQLPITELWCLDQIEISDTAIDYGIIRLLSANNPQGYNNQPFPHADGYALTIAKAGHQQTDICFYNLELKSYRYLTSTRTTSEYSPMIAEDDSVFYVVRVDTSNNQNLWALPLNLSHGGHNVLPGIDNVGYFQRFNQDSFIVFLTGEPHQLAIASLTSHDKYVFTSNVGRCFKVLGNDIYFVHKLTPQSWYLKKYSLLTRRSTIVCLMPKLIEDFMLNDGHVWLADGGKLLCRPLEGKLTWRTMADLTELGLNHITRMSIDDQRLYLINKKNQE